MLADLHTVKCCFPLLAIKRNWRACKRDEIEGGETLHIFYDSRLYIRFFPLLHKCGRNDER